MSTCAEQWRGGRRVLAGAVVLLAGVLTGCAGSAPSLSYTTSLVDAQIGAHRLERDEHLKLGPVRLSLLRALLRAVGDEVDEEARAFIGDTRSLEIASYRIEPAVDGDTAIDLGELEQVLRNRGWSRVAMERGDGELSLIMLREDGRGRVRGLYVVSLDSNELELVHLEGRLDRAIALALAEDSEAAEALVEVAGAG